MHGYKLILVYLLLILTTAGFHISSSANERFRPQTPEDLQVFESEQGHRLLKARVMYADYEAIREDFAFLKEADDNTINQWILSFAHISKTQLRLWGIRFVGRGQPHPLDLPKDTDLAGFYDQSEYIDKASDLNIYRPWGYGRADVMKVYDPTGRAAGLIDMKGTGSDRTEGQVKEFFQAAKLGESERRLKLNRLFNRDHSDGLMAGGEGVAEITREKAIRYQLEVENLKSNTAWGTVRNYFLVDTGLEILKSDGTTTPAAIVARQAHWRDPHTFYMGSSALLALKNSHPSGRPPKVTDDFGFLQRSMNANLVDFGGSMPGHEVLAQNFYFLPLADGEDEIMRTDPQNSTAWVWGHEAYAAALREDNPHIIFNHVAEMVQPIKDLWLESKANEFVVPDLKKRIRAWSLLLSPQNEEALQEALAMIEQAQETRFLNALLTRAHIDVIFNLIRRLSPKGRAQLADILEPEDWLTRNTLHPDNQQYVEFYSALSNHPDPNFRRVAYIALIKRVASTQRPDVSPLIVPLLRRALTEPDQDLRFLLIEPLDSIHTKSPRLVPYLLRLANDPTTPGRSYIAQSLKKHSEGGRRVIQALKLLKRHESDRQEKVQINTILTELKKIQGICSWLLHW